MLRKWIGRGFGGVRGGIDAGVDGSEGLIYVGLTVVVFYDEIKVMGGVNGGDEFISELVQYELN